MIDEFPDKIWEADERLNRAFAEILIVAPEHLRTLANELQSKAYEATRTLGEASRIVAARTATREAGIAYEAAVREFFGVSESSKNHPDGTSAE